MMCGVDRVFEDLKARYGLSKRLDDRGIELLDEAKRKLVLCLISEDVGEVYEWVKHVDNVLSEIRKRFSIKGLTLPKEFNSFVADPIEHLKKKLFNYVNDYLSGRLGIEEFVKRSSSAINTSLRTNARSCYQLWGFASILIHLGDMGYEIVYPEHKFVNFDRSGKQKLGVIPPNIIMLNLEKGFLSFFYEAPRPLSWEDTSDLQKVWSLYTALRPDLMVYSGKTLNIVDLGSSPPVKRPNAILEFKELEDWYLRVRDLKGYLRKPMTAEEWRYRWWLRLREELMKIADLQHVAEVESSSKVGVVEGGREPSMRVREYQLILMYKVVYRPDRTFLVARARIPREIKRYLESNGVEVYDYIGFDLGRLRDVAEELSKFANYGDEESITIEIPKRVAQLVSRTSKMLGLSYAEAIEYALKNLLNTVVGDRL